MKKVFQVVGVMSLLFVVWKLFSFYSNEHESDTVFQTKFNENYSVYALNLPDNPTFAGEPMPLYLPDIAERLDRELLVNTYWQSQGLLFFKRANKYFPIIEPILKKHGIPEDFKYLPLIESGFENVVSPAGATGMWQIMKATGKQYGLEINGEVDERYHLEKSTEVACKLLLDAKEELGSWTLAAASYNMGLNGVKKQLARQQVDDYYDLLLNRETSRYVFRITAIKYIMSNPEGFGFNLRKKDLYSRIPTKTVKVDTAVTSFPEFARKQGINYKILKIHNPWLRESYLSNKIGKTYFIEIPKKGYYSKEEIENTSQTLTDTTSVETTIQDSSNITVDSTDTSTPTDTTTIEE